MTRTMPKPDPVRFSTIAHRDHLFCNPIAPEKIDAIVGLLDLPPAARVLDVGCGKGELLIRIAERYQVQGVGIDTNAEFLREAKERAAGRLPGAGLELLERDFREVPLAADAFDLTICVGSTHACGGYAETLRALSRATRSGGQILVGEGYWRREPSPAYLEALGATRDDYLDHAGNVALGEAEGLVPLYSVTSSEDDWDHYEGLYAASIERHCQEHPDDPEREGMLDRIRAWRRAYLRAGRDTLGFGLYLFLVGES